MRWGMAIELKRCIGCNACVLACKAEHFLPPKIFYNRVLIGEKGKYPQVTKLIYSVRCNHCAEPKCVKVCPTGATQQREDGIVWVDETKCVGCRYCMVACPYQMRQMHEDADAQYFPGQELTEHEKMGKVLYPHTPGVVEKCVFCKRENRFRHSAGTETRGRPRCLSRLRHRLPHQGNTLRRPRRPKQRNKPRHKREARPRIPSGV